MLKIMLDPGHGAGKAHNRGFVNIPNFNYSNEGDCNFYYAKNYLKPELEKYGIYVGMTRKSIYDNPSLYQRGRMAKGFDLLVSLHSNAVNGLATGAEIWDSTNPKESIKPLTDKLTLAISKAIGTNDRGTKYRKNNSGSNYYGILRYGLAKHNFIIEHAFHDNYTDCSKYVNSLPKIAKETARVIAEYFGVTKNTTNKPIANTITDAGKDFLERVFKGIEKTDKKIFPSVTLAQACLESNRGKSELAKKANNLFGIKASKEWSGEVYSKNTKEQKSNGEIYSIVANFRKYEKIDDSIKDHDNFFTSTDWRKNYYKKVLNAKDWKEQCNALTGTYATDLSYAKKLINLIEKYELYKYDKRESVKVIDKTKPSDWAKDSWKWAIDKGITDGSNPKENCTREEVITMIKRATEVEYGKSNNSDSGSTGYSTGV
ncbi:MAG: glucosaminidase domain-containing protein [Peptoniphilaceae bacterium]